MRGVPLRQEPQKAEWTLGVQLTQVTSNFLCARAAQRFGKHKLLGLTRDFWFGSSERGLGICFPSTFQVRLMLLGQGPHFGNHQTHPSLRKL